MEEEALTGDKPWQLKGEVTARTRPENSLLQEDVEFDSNVAPTPAVTVETTQTLESLIIQRIKDKVGNHNKHTSLLRITTGHIYGHHDVQLERMLPPPHNDRQACKRT